MGAGGAEKLVSELCSEQSEVAEVTLFTFTQQNDIFQENLSNNVKFEAQSGEGFWNFRQLTNLYKCIKSHNVIHVHLFPSIYIVALLSFLFNNKKFYYTEHNTNNRRRKWQYYVLEKIVYSRYNKVICISKAVERELTKWIGKYPPKAIIENFVDIKKIQNEGAYTKKKLGVEEKMVLVMVGSFTKQKDQKTIIDALSFLPDHYSLLLVGGGPLKASLEDYVAAKNLAKRVSFLGIRRDIINILKACDYGILSSNWEGFGIVALEYMAAGLVAIGSNVEGLNEVIPLSKNLFDPGDPISLANRIKALEDEDINSIIGEQSKYILNFDIHASVKKHMNAYTS